MWLQVALVFPHVCPNDIAILGGDLGFGPEIAADAPDGGDLPLCPLSGGHGGDTCFIYATAHLTGSPLLPDAVRLDLVARSGSALAPRDMPWRRARPHHLLFETRAPPAL